jgi:tol-pal system protein YbgF
MRTFTSIAFGVFCVVLLASPASAADKEQRQMMADIRLLQEQNQQLQNQLQTLLAQVTDALKAVNARIDDQTDATRKALADQKLTMDNLSGDVRVIREKLDDTSVRIGTLSQEVDALRNGVQQMVTRPPVLPADTTAAAGATGAASATAGAGAATPPADTGAAPPAVAPPPAPPAELTTSPQKLWDQAFSDYSIGQWDLAIQGFETFIRTFPTSDMADDAQVIIGRANLNAGRNEQAVEAFDSVIRNYPNGNAVPDAYYGKGIALKNLKQLDAAREAFSTVVMKYPESTAAILAKQQLAQ